MKSTELSGTPVKSIPFSTLYETFASIPCAASVARACSIIALEMSVHTSDLHLGASLLENLPPPQPSSSTSAPGPRYGCVHATTRDANGAPPHSSPRVPAPLLSAASLLHSSG